MPSYGRRSWNRKRVSVLLLKEESLNVEVEARPAGKKENVVIPGLSRDRLSPGKKRNRDHQRGIDRGTKEAGRRVETAEFERNCWRRIVVGRGKEGKAKLAPNRKEKNSSKGGD